MHWVPMLFLRALEKAFAAGELNFFSAHRHLHGPAACSGVTWHRPGRLNCEPEKKLPKAVTPFFQSV